MNSRHSISAVTIALTMAGALLIPELAHADSERRIFSTAHLGYAMESDSSTGFRNAGGSMMIFDVSYLMNESIDLGMRTAGTGAEQNGAKFYRMGAGPMIRARATENLAFVLSGMRFQETGMNSADDEQAYGSSGNALMLSWERTHRLAKRVEVSWGGFVSQHRGGFTPTSGSSMTLEPRFASVSRNVGMTRGFEFALRTAL